VKLNLYLKLRDAPAAFGVLPRRTLWLMTHDGPAHSWLLWGELPADLADELAQRLARALTIPIEHDDQPLNRTTDPHQPSLFGDDA